MTVSGSARFTATIAILVVLLSVGTVLPIILPGPEPAATPRFEKTALEIETDLDRMFPCRPGVASTDKDYEADYGCSGYFVIEPRGKSAPPDRIETRPLLERFETNGTRTRLEVSPNYGKVVRYLFPEWSQADAWVASSIEHARQSACPKMAHADGIWIVVRQFVSTPKYRYAQLIITTDDSEIAHLRDRGNEMCDDPVVIEEIR